MTTPEGLGNEPSRMPPADLASAFNAPPPAATDRARTLAGRLRPVLPPDTSPAPTAPGGQAAATEPARPQRQRTATSRKTTKDAAQSGAVHPIVVYVPVSIRDRLREAVTSDATYTDLVLDALDAHHRDLATHFNTGRGNEDSLFAGRGRRRRLRHDEPQVQISLRPLADDLAVIDRLTEDLGAPSRSALITAALTRHLT